MYIINQSNTSADSGVLHLPTFGCVNVEKSNVHSYGIGSLQEVATSWFRLGADSLWHWDESDDKAVQSAAITRLCCNFNNSALSGVELFASSLNFSVNHPSISGFRWKSFLFHSDMKCQHYLLAKWFAVTFYLIWTLVDDGLCQMTAALG
jgi:hypothetical protein